MFASATKTKQFDFSFSDVLVSQNMSDAVLPAPSQVSSGGNFQLPAHPSLYKPIPGSIWGFSPFIDYGQF